MYIVSLDGWFWGMKGLGRITMIDQFLPVTTAGEANVEISTCAERSTCAGDDNAFDSLVQVEHWVGQLEIVHHLDGEGIALFGTIERNDYDGGGFGGMFGIVGDLDVPYGQSRVRLGDLDFDWVG
jgi:hypothetical protein